MYGVVNFPLYKVPEADSALFPAPGLALAEAIGSVVRIS
jgi:hypothetical protein